MSASLSFANLFTYGIEDPSQRLPLSRLSDGDGHIHGLLRLALSGNVMPHMGFFGPDDVCFNTWIEELSHITRLLSESDVAAYTFDEGEQGQPAFHFQRQGDLLLVSVVDSTLSGAAGEPSYQGVTCSWESFLSAVASFFASFHGALFTQCPLVAETWWRMHAPGHPGQLGRLE
jgi:hypothetical protein